MVQCRASRGDELWQDRVKTYDESSPLSLNVVASSLLSPDLESDEIVGGRRCDRTEVS